MPTTDTRNNQLDHGPFNPRLKLLGMTDEVQRAIVAEAKTLAETRHTAQNRTLLLAVGRSRYAEEDQTLAARRIV